jgi:transaldolase
MKFFLESANLNEIKKAHDLELLDGVITHPKFLVEEGINNREKTIAHYKSICKIALGADLCVDVLATDYEGIIKQAKFLAAISGQIVVNIPMMAEGIKAIKFLKAEGIKTNCMFIHSMGQALLAAKAEATYVSLDIAFGGSSFSETLSSIKVLQNIYNTLPARPQIIVSSVFDPEYVVEFLKIGIDVIASSIDTIQKLIMHPRTDVERDKLLNDISLIDN